MSEDQATDSDPTDPQTDAPASPADAFRLEASRQRADAFRRQAALQLGGAFVSRTGGFGTDHERLSIARLIWAFADALIAAEHMPPLPNEAELAEKAAIEAASRPRPRAATPSDEWGVRDEWGELHKGFVSRAEAQAYADGALPGARVEQLAGPEVNDRVAAVA